MLELRGLRAFSLSATRDDGRISCDAEGAFAGGVPLIERAQVDDTSGTWTVRPVAELNDELTVRYGLPIDVAAKVGALALIANALNRGDLAMAAIVTVQMQFPNPPSPAKGIETADDIMRRALELHRSRLLKANWDPAKHPRAGAPPNPGWFAPVPTGPESANVVPAAAVGNPWDKPVLLEGGGGGGVPRGTLELPFPRGLPRFLSPRGSPPKPPTPGGRHRRLRPQAKRNLRFHSQVVYRHSSRHTYPAAKPLVSFRVRTTLISHCRVDMMVQLHPCEEAPDMMELLYRMLKDTQRR